MSNTPKIRFEGFTDDWEERKLEDVVDFLDTMRKPLEGLKRVSGPYPYYGASGIVDYVDGFLFDEELVLLSEDGANITDRNYPVCFLASGKYWVNNHAHVLRTKNGNENNFICNSLERKDYKQYNSGMAMPKLNQEVCRSIPLHCPCYEEQKKIGDYFRNLDNLITLHQRKCDETKELKNYMLQKMFPKAGEKVPEIRFAGFTDDWEQRKLSNMSDFITKGATPTTYGYDWVDEGIPFFRNDAIKDNYFVFGDYSFISEEANEALSRSEITRDDILVAITGDIGKVGIVPKSIDRANINQHTARIRIIRDAVPYFIYQSLAREEQQKIYQKIKTGLSMPQLSLEQIRETEIMCPAIDEQTKIGDFFSNLDNLITLHQRKCDNLKMLKQYMLQNMFPQKG